MVVCAMLVGTWCTVPYVRCATPPGDHDIIDHHRVQPGQRFRRCVGELTYVPDSTSGFPNTWYLIPDT